MRRFLRRTSCYILSAMGLCAMALVSQQPVAAADDAVTGQQIYRTICAACHGEQGEGTKKHKEPLAGDRSVRQLAELIAETMPEDDPGSLAADDAHRVAAYIYDAFYSPIARARNQPARIQLSRLTVRQYRLAVADLVGSFRSPATWGDARGLAAEYFRGRDFNNQARALERVDATVDFQFATDAPVPEISEPHAFSIRWRGALMVPDTGDYEFVVSTENAARLWINELKQPLIDAWVKSGNDTQYRANLFLVGGRVYPLRLEFTKAKQGVDDSNKQDRKPPPSPASITLLWRRPHRVLEPIPARHLSPDSAAESFVCATPFPPDDRSYGWQRGTSISKAWEEATTAAAVETARYVAARLNELAGTRDDAPDRLQKLRAFCHTFALRAFRRPLGDEQTEMLIDKQFAAADNPETAVKRVVLLLLKSPRFLFRELGRPDQYDVAARLSFGLWDSVPDNQLLDAARDGRLATRQQVAQQAERMLPDRRAGSKLREFLLTWLTADSEADLSKDEQAYPGFDAETIADLRTSLELFLDDVLWSDGSDYRRLLLAEEVFLNHRLAAFYGADPIAEGEFAKVTLDAGKRAGILTHPYLMANFAHHRETSPIHRGVFLARGILGQTLRPPPQAVAPLAPDLHPELTTRQRVVVQTKATSCMTCHAIINPLGFTLEHFDAVGRYRESDRGKPVDATASYPTRAGTSVQLSGARQLAEFLAGSQETHAAFAEQLFHHLVQQPVQAYGEETLVELRDAFAKHEFNIRRLAVDVMVASALFGCEAKLTARLETTE